MKIVQQGKVSLISIDNKTKEIQSEEQSVIVQENKENQADEEKSESKSESKSEPKSESESRSESESSRSSPTKEKHHKKSKVKKFVKGMKNLFKSESKDSEGDSSSSRKSSVAELVGGMKNISQALILKEDHDYQTKTKIKHSSFTNYLHENYVTPQAASHLHEAEREPPKQEITTKIPLSPNYPRDQLKEATSEVDE